MTLFRPSLVLCSALLAGSGCGDTVVGPLDGQAFGLTTVDGAPLPAEIESDGGFAWTVLADTIRFTAGDTWARRQIQRRRLPGAAEELQDLASDGFVSRFGGEIVLDVVCDDTRLALCVAPDRLRAEGSGMRMDRTAYHAGVNLVFERIP